MFKTKFIVAAATVACIATTPVLASEAHDAKYYLDKIQEVEKDAKTENVDLLGKLSGNINIGEEDNKTSLGIKAEFTADAQVDLGEGFLMECAANMDISMMGESQSVAVSVYGKDGEDGIAFASRTLENGEFSEWMATKYAMSVEDLMQQITQVQDSDISYDFLKVEDDGEASGRITLSGDLADFDMSAVDMSAFGDSVEDLDAYTEMADNMHIIMTINADAETFELTGMQFDFSQIDWASIASQSGLDGVEVDITEASIQAVFSHDITDIVIPEEATAKMAEAEAVDPYSADEDISTPPVEVDVDKVEETEF